MQVVSSIETTRAAVAEARRAGAGIGFVPTMGYLHDGHLALAAASKQHASFTVMSIFVNPLQFGPTEDLAKYPRDETGDETKAESAGVSLLFRPTASEMYGDRPQVTVTPGAIADRWEGAIRPGHFAGVLTVVAKLFNIVQPDVAIFGQKDFQQAALIRAMVRDLDFPLTLVVHPTVRESDGLAMSSRNSYLRGNDRVQARALSSALRSIQQRFADGVRDESALIALGSDVVAEHHGVKLDYLTVVHPDDLVPVEQAEEGHVILIAARVGPTRLLDNSVLGAGERWLSARAASAGVAGGSGRA